MSVTPVEIALEEQSGEHERLLATGTVAQQIANVVTTLSMLVVVTAVARSLSLPAFGTYGLLVSIATYLLLAQTSVEGAAVKAIAEATDQDARDRAFSTALLLYAGAGVVCGVAVAVIGAGLVSVIGVPAGLQAEARLGAVALGAVMIVGWPAKTFQDVLRGGHLFVLAAGAEVVGYLLFAAVTLALLAVDAPLWLLIGAGGSIPPLIGMTAAVVVLVWKRLPYRYRRAAVTRDSMRSFLALSGSLFSMGIADLVIYALDRVILAAFRSTATVGLYEGPVRAHNLVRQLNGTLALTVLPAAARYVEQDDRTRLRELLLRGTRYVCAAVVPVALTLMLLAQPILHVWLGPKFDVGAAAMTILISYWLFASSTAVAGPMLVAVGRARALAVLAWALAITSLVLSLALTPPFGLEGVVLGTAIPSILLVPVLLRMASESFDVGVRDFGREVWIPVFSTALPLVAALAGLRIVGLPNEVAAVGAACILPVLAYWALFYALWLRPNEKRLIRSVLRTLAPGGG